LKPQKWVKVLKENGEGEEERPVEALMVLKYGGVLTHAGRKQVNYLMFQTRRMNKLSFEFSMLFPSDASQTYSYFKMNKQ
jgi:hypothetical protein